MAKLGPVGGRSLVDSAHHPLPLPPPGDLTGQPLRLPQTPNEGQRSARDRDYSADRVLLSTVEWMDSKERQKIFGQHSRVSSLTPHPKRNFFAHDHSLKAETQASVTG
jgi:hypothetical protein